MKKRRVLENGTYRLILTEMRGEDHNGTIVFFVNYCGMNPFTGDTITMTDSFCNNKKDIDCIRFFNFLTDNNVEYVDYEDLVGMVVDVDVEAVPIFNGKKVRHYFSNWQLVAPPPSYDK